MSQNNEGACSGPKLKVPVCGLELSLDKSVFEGVGGGEGTGVAVDYSTEEQWTGKRWIDGKKIYQKTLYLEGFPNNSARAYPHNIDSMETVVDFSGVYHVENGKFQPLPRVSSSTSIVALTADLENVSIKTYVSSTDYPAAKAYVTLQYTCSDR